MEIHNDPEVQKILRDLQKIEQERLGPAGRSKMVDFSGLREVPGAVDVNIDIKKAYMIMSQLETKGRYLIGDSGTSFGATQLQMGGFLGWLANDSKTESVTGLSSQSLKNLSNTWTKERKNVRKIDLWVPISVDEADVREFMRKNPRKVIRRMEGTTVRYDPENLTIVKVRNGGRTLAGQRLNLSAIGNLGIDTSSPIVIKKLQDAIIGYITDNVIRSAIVKLLMQKEDPATFSKFKQLFTVRNVRGNQELRNLADRASQRDFMSRIEAVVNMVKESGYDVNSPNSYNIYQLLVISNASGIGAVQRFLKHKKEFYPGNLTYLRRANPYIQKITGMASDFPTSGGMGGHTSLASLKISKRAGDIHPLSGQAGAIRDLVERWLNREADLADMLPFGVTYIGRVFDTDPPTILIRVDKSVGPALRELLPTSIKRHPIEIAYDATRSVEPETAPVKKRKPKKTEELPAISIVGPYVQEFNYLLSNYRHIKDESQKELKKLNRKETVTDQDVERGIVTYLTQKYPEAAAKLDKLVEDNRGRNTLPGIGASFVLSGLPAKVAKHIAKRATFKLQFPSQYAEDIKSGKREMTIRPGDIPSAIEDVVQCETYSGAPICHVLITSKEVMSVPRIRKAFGKKVANELERKFGPDSRFVVIRFCRHDVESHDDDYDNNSYGKLVGQEPQQFDDGGTLEHVPFGRTVFPVEPGAYHACDDMFISARAIKQVRAIWDIADKLSLATDMDPDEWLRLHNMQEEEEEESPDEEIEEFSPEWRRQEDERLRNRIEEQKKDLLTAPQVVEKAPADPVGAPQPTAPVQEIEKKKPKKKRETFEEYIKKTLSPGETPKDEDTESDEVGDLLRQLEEGEDLDELVGVKEETAPKEDSGVTTVKLTNKKTFWGFSLAPPEGGWADPPATPQMSEEAQERFSPQSMRNDNAMGKLFDDSTTWAVLGRQPNKEEILQKWILPAILYNVGKKWFDVNKHRAEIGGAPFSMFNDMERDHVKKSGKSLDETANGQAYMHIITAHVTDLVNYFFTHRSYSRTPIDGFIRSNLTNRMMMEMGARHDYIPITKPICAVCKKENPNKLQIMRKHGKSWSCDNCKEKAKEIINNDAAQIKIQISSLESQSGNMADTLSGAKQGVLQAKVNIEDLGETPRTLEKLRQAEQNYAEVQKSSSSIHGEIDAAKDMLKTTLRGARKYLNQSAVPYYHLWCINETCPGLLIPLSFVNWDKKEFWESEEGKTAAAYLKSYYGMVQPSDEEQSAQDDIPKEILERKNIGSLMPHKKLWSVPFVCPHDGIEFTIKEAWGKGYMGRGGILWDPWRTRLWAPQEGRAKNKITTHDDSSPAVSEDIDEIMTTEKLSGYAKDIMLKKYLAKFKSNEQQKQWVKHPLTDANWLGMSQSLKLYETMREFSSTSPQTYVGWMASREFKSVVRRHSDGITRTETKIVPYNKARDEVYVPILQRWFDNMSGEENGFSKYGLRNWLVDEENDGIPSYPNRQSLLTGDEKDKQDIKNKLVDLGKDGTHFVVRAGENGFKINLLAKKRSGGRGFGIQPRMIRILGVWELEQGDLGSLGSKQLEGVSALDYQTAVSLKSDKPNRLREIRGHDFVGAVFEQELSQFVPGSYILVRAYLMPSTRGSSPIGQIQRARADADDEQLLAQFGRLALLHEDDPKFWGEFEKEMEQYKQNPDKIKELVQKHLGQAKEAQQRAWRMIISKRHQFPLSLRHYQ